MQLSKIIFWKSYRNVTKYHNMRRMQIVASGAGQESV